MNINKIFEFQSALLDRLKTVSVILIKPDKDGEFEYDDLCDLPNTFYVDRHEYYTPMAIIEVHNGELICKETGESNNIQKLSSDELEMGDLLILCYYLHMTCGVDFPTI